MSAYCGKYKDELIKNAAYIGTPGKGILAADESTGTIGKRFASINVENVEDNRRALRELLFTTPGALQHISGVILFEETLYQSSKAGKPFVDILKENNVLPGIKVDKGTVELAGTDKETTTQGHDDLGKRCAKYYEAGARFASRSDFHCPGPHTHLAAKTAKAYTNGQKHNRQGRCMGLLDDASKEGNEVRECLYHRHAPRSTRSSPNLKSL